MKLAFSGHIDLIEKDKKQIQQLLKEKLLYLQQHKDLTKVVVGVAEGADQLAIEVCKELNIRIQFLNEVVIQKTDETDAKYYERQCEYLVANYSQFIVLWDGLFTEKIGGTSWLVHLLINQSKDKVLHHLLTPRKSNPYASSNLNTKGFQAFDNDLNAKLPWLPEYSWASFILGNQIKKLKQQQWISDTQSILQSFIIPGILALITLLLGMIGYAKNYPENWVDNFYRSINFITLNNFFFKGDNVLLEIARVTGLLTPLTAIALGLYKATFYFRKSRRVKKWAKEPMQFAIVIGNNNEANDLASDLNQKKYNVLQFVLNQNNNELIQVGQKHFKKNLFSNIDEKLFGELVSKAKLIYLMDTDEVNLHQALQFKSFLKKQNPTTIESVFIHLRNFEKAKLLNNIGSVLAGKLKIFNIPQNTVRRLLNHYPTDWRNSESDTIAIHIVDYNELSEALCEQLLSQLHLDASVKIELTIYIPNPEITESAFYSKFSSLTKKEKNSQIEHYVWANWTFRFLNFEEQVNFNQPFYQNIVKDLETNKTTSVYICSENSEASTSWLAGYLPRLNQIKLETLEKIQLFCYYNHPDKTQEIQIERYLNKLAPNLLINCFGNHLDECSYNALNEDTLDDMAIEITKWYHQNYNTTPWNPNTSWNLTSYIDKQSSNQAADHIWLKLRWLIRNSKTRLNTLEDYINKFNQLEGDYLHQLSEMEHRRWCANLALSGYEVLPEKYSKDWIENKQYLKKQFYHRDLIPFSQLAPKDQEKDASQIKGIPHFLLNTYQSNQTI